MNIGKNLAARCGAGKMVGLDRETIAMSATNEKELCAVNCADRVERGITNLSDEIASQIAGAAVISRPADAVKELVENALDAGARSIEVEIRGGGSELIAVADDGCGMARTDALLALKWHTTSKIREVADLGSIRTLGFRGDALPAVASLSRLRMQTRRSDDEQGVELAADAGHVEDVRECEAPAGTRIEVRELLFNSPRQRSFLKSPATEQDAITDVLRGLAVANHLVRFMLTADGKAALQLPRASSPLQRFSQLFGAKQAAKYLRFDRVSEGIRVRGLAAPADENFATTRMLFTFINGRPVRSKMLISAIEQGYMTILPEMGRRHPSAVVFLDMPRGAMDVTIDPRKANIGFRNSGTVFAAVYETLCGLRDELDTQCLRNHGEEPWPQAPAPRRRRRRKSGKASNVIEFRPRAREIAADGPKAAS